MTLRCVIRNIYRPPNRYVECAQLALVDRSLGDLEVPLWTLNEMLARPANAELTIGQEILVTCVLPAADITTGDAG